MTSDLAYPIESGLSPQILPLQSDYSKIKNAYDGSSAVFKLLRLETWGPSLMNLGYFPFRGPLSFLNILQNQEFAQRRLVMKSVELLGVRGRQRVLDVACGRGKSSFIVRCLHPETSVIGLDLLEPNIQVARTLFDQVENLTYQVGNAEELNFPDGTFDCLMCIEAAFHFQNRARFLQESSRVLRPGGRLLVVDFAWKSDVERMHRNDPETRLVRKIWQWEDLYSISEYGRVANDAGLVRVAHEDWSGAVTGPIQKIFQMYSSIGNSWIGREFLKWRNPLYCAISEADWREMAAAVRAHDSVRRLTRYMAFVFEKH
jgi:ubiquinone/menaquinone biosynthesis C-methylase UbiE